MILADLPPSFIRTLAVLLGLLWGSFLNVVIHRVPREMSVVRPGSHCPACKAPIKPWDNIPVVSYLVLRGRARCCGARMSPRYLLVEAIGGVLSLAIVEAVVLRMPGGTPLERAAGIYVIDLALALGLTAAAFIDLEHMILPDSITIGGAVLGLASASLREMSYVDAATGAAVGFGLVWLPFVFVYPRLRGKAGMGLGDAKLLMLAGAWFGWSGALFVLAAGAVQGTVATLVMLLARGRIEEPEAVKKEREELMAELETMSPEERAKVEEELADDPLFAEAGEGFGQARIAFGPFLILATLELLLFGRELAHLWASWLNVD